MINGKDLPYMKQEKRFIVDILFVLALFGVFAVSALTLVTIGAEVYRHTVQDMDSNYETRTAAAYITEKVRQNDVYAEEGGSNACLTTLNDVPALMLTRTLDDGAYCTYLYFHDGFLKELYIQKGFSYGGDTLDAGTEIIELSALDIKQFSLNLLSVEMTTTNNNCHTIFIATHCDINEDERILGP